MGNKSVRLTDEKALFLGLGLNKHDKGRKTARYVISPEQIEGLSVFNKSETKPNDYKKPKFVLSAWNEKGYMMDIDEYCDRYKLPRKDISSYKLISHTGTPFYNIVFKENKELEEVIDYAFIDKIVKKHIKRVKIKVTKIESDTFDRVIYTDGHIGMTPNKSGYSLYGGKWDEEELEDRLKIMIEEITRNKTGNLLVIDDLGDFVDGWDGETVRKGHKLPQNMDNQKMFDVGVDFKIKMVDALVKTYPKIILNNICEDNHAGAFGYIINSAVKNILNYKYKNVEVVNHRKFINDYMVGRHCFVISHGKDSHALKFGFKPHLDPKQIEKIDQYLKANDIYKKADFIEFSKGDSHQMLLDYCSSDDFDYFNYPALSPSSEWVQTNFRKGRSGFVLQNVSYNSRDKVVKPYFFNI